MRAAVVPLFAAMALAIGAVAFVTLRPAAGGHWRITLAGIVSGTIAAAVVIGAWQSIGRWRRFRTAAGLVILGACGGIGTLELVNRIAPATVRIERPVVATRPSREVLTFVTDPVMRTWTHARGIPRAGGCVTATLHRGVLGGMWMTDVAAARCSARRGTAGDAVIVPDADDTRVALAPAGPLSPDRRADGARRRPADGDAMPPRARYRLARALYPACGAGTVG